LRRRIVSRAKVAATATKLLTIKNICSTAV
jgi:hypothetical protein